MDQMPVSDAVRNGRPWWQICCGGCLLLVVALVIGGFILMRVFAGPGLKQLGGLPANFPSTIVPYRLNEAQSITYLEGASKSKILNVLYSPMRLFGIAAGQNASGTGSAADAARAADAFGKDVRYIDTVTITWKGLRVSSSDLLKYYGEQFSNAGLTSTYSHDESEGSDDVTGVRQGIIAELNIQRGADATMTGGVILVVSYSNKQ